MTIQNVGNRALVHFSSAVCKANTIPLCYLSSPTSDSLQSGPIASTSKPTQLSARALLDLDMNVASFQPQQDSLLLSLTEGKRVLPGPRVGEKGRVLGRESPGKGRGL